MISIIIPVYNGEKYICDIYANIKKANYDGEYEIIFINDGSKDRSAEILDKLSEEDSSVKVIHQQNKGVCVARNAGLDNASGEYICFLDVDDAIDVNYFKIFMDCIERENVEVAFCYMTPEAEEVNPDCLEYVFYNRNEALSDFLMRKFQIGVCGLLVARDVIAKNHLRFMEGYKYGEDLHMAWKIFNSVDRMVYIKAPLYIYKQNEGSTMTRIDASKLDAITIMDELERYFQATNEEFYPLFKQYATARNAWAILWQAVRFLDWKGFKEFLNLHDFKTEMKKLYSFPDVRVKLSATCFVFSTRIYYILVKMMVKNYRR